MFPLKSNRFAQEPAKSLDHKNPSRNQYENPLYTTKPPAAFLRPWPMGPYGPSQDLPGKVSLARCPTPALANKYYILVSIILYQKSARA